MFDNLDAVGVAGIVVALGGLGVIAVQSPIVAAGLALVFVGVALAVRSLVQSVLQTFGMV